MIIAFRTHSYRKLAWLVEELMVMSECNECKVNGFSYTFSMEQKAFNDAKTVCENMMGGGNLARNLDEETYTMFNDCCSNGNQYWIGLLRCNDQPNGSENSQYRWLGSNDCTSAAHLTLAPSHTTSSCQGVSISLNPNSQEIPSASASDCLGGNMRYICQFPDLSSPGRPNQNTFQIANDNFPSHPPEISESDKANFPTLSSTKNLESASAYFLTIPSNKNFDSASEKFSTLCFTQNSEVGKGLIVGLSISVALLLLLAIILALFVVKKRCFMDFHKNENCSIVARSEQERNDVNDRRQIVYNIAYNR